jgi:predicted dehydrogenase
VSAAEFTAIVVGAGNMGAEQARILRQLPGWNLAGICDPDPTAASARASELGVRCWPDLKAALRDVLPDVVAVCTPNASHAGIAILAANSGVRAVHCEKPMAVNLADARRMVQVCEERGVLLVVNHQRRIGSDLLKMRELIDANAIGPVTRLRGFCAGDFLSDGTHVVDSLLWLAGDADPVEVDAEMALFPADASAPSGLRRRYGHPVEAGMRLRARLENGLLLEIATGTLQEKKAYQEYLVEGAAGRLWRVGDQLQPNVFLSLDGKPGNLGTVFDPQKWYSYPSLSTADQEAASSREWSVVDAPQNVVPGGNIGSSYSLLHKLLSGTCASPHPMDARVAFRGFELVMAAYESARMACKITLPLAQVRFPLELISESSASAQPATPAQPSPFSA